MDHSPKTTSAFQHLNLINLSVLKEAVHLDNELILIDNFDLSNTSSDESLFFTQYPVKLSFTVVIIIFSGSMHYRINLEEFWAYSNDLITVQKGAIGEFLHSSPDLQVVVIAFSNEFFHMNDHPELAMKMQQMLYGNPVSHFSGESLKEMRMIYELMKKKISETDNPFRKEILQGYVRALMYTTLHKMLETLQQVPAYIRNDRQHEIYMQFIREVQKNYQRERSVAFYAGRLCITPKHLSQTVLKASGRLAGEWISDYVILEAKALIKSHCYTVQQISEILHFPNQSFFGRYFKKKVGCTPKAYQKNIR